MVEAEQAGLGSGLDPNSSGGRGLPYDQRDHNPLSSLLEIWNIFIVVSKKFGIYLIHACRLVADLDLFINKK